MKYHLQTGLCKPTLFSGLTMLGIPNIFTMDLMDLSFLNDPDLLLGLWRGTIKHYPPDNISTWDWAVLKNQKWWRAHGMTIKAAVPFIPSSFGHAPHNPAEKGTKLGSLSCIFMVLGLFCFDTSSHGPTGSTTANWFLEFKYSSILLLLHKDSRMVTKPSRISRDFTTKEGITHSFHLSQHTFTHLHHSRDSSSWSACLLCTVDDGDCYWQSWQRNSSRQRLLPKS